jgi:uncharacterized membrane protein
MAKLPNPLKLPKWTREIGWRTVAGAVLLGGIIHIGATFALPVFGPSSAFLRLREILPVNRMVILPPPQPGKQLLPFMMPDALYAMCRYDIRTDPVSVTATLAEPGWALSLHSPQGDNYYVMPAQQLKRSEVTLVVVQGGERQSEAGPVPRRVGAVGSHIASPASEGLIIVRAPLKGLAWRADTEAALRRANCAPVKRQ